MELTLKYPLFYKSRMGGVLAVHGDNGLTKNKKKLAYTCSVCSTDEELYPNLFYSAKVHLDAGKDSCGCSKKPEWTKHQRRVMLNRKAVESGTTFIDFTEKFRGNLTTVHFECPLHGEFTSNTVNVLSSEISPCNDCARAYSGYGRRLSRGDVIKRFIKSGQFPEGSTFTPTEDLCKWVYHCPVCIEDDYTKAGLCDGKFVSDRGSLEKGYLPCRCSVYPRLSREQALFRTSNIIREYKRKNKIDLLDANPEKYLKCLSNGDYLLDYNKMQEEMPREYRNSNLDNLYVIKMRDDKEVMIKVGRTFNLKERFYPYKRLYDIDLLVCATADNEIIKRLEKQLLSEFNHLRYHPNKFFKGHTECLTLESEKILTEEFIMNKMRGIAYG